MDTPTIGQLVRAGALFVANHSGGKDSQAMLIKLLTMVPAWQILVVHASLGEMEWEGALELARDQAAAAGTAFVVARSRRTLFDMVIDRHAVRPDVPSWPSSANRQCTSDLKRGPIQREVRRFADDSAYKIIVNCMGLRAQESPRRAKKEVFRLNESASNSKRRWYEWLPIHDWSVDRVFGTIREAGQQPHPAYAAGNERLSCVFCIMGSKADLANGAKHRPELFEKYLELERRTGYTMHQSRKPLQQLIDDAAALTEKGITQC